VHFNATCIETVRRVTERLKASSREIVSGAGHDAVYVSRVAPTAMIFIPCRDGLSHNPAERAEKDHCALGAQVLLENVLSLGA
jgi:N-carbamoyl-L-amino-acid hydrolase